MYISVIDENSRNAVKTAFIYLLVSLFWIIFGAIYEAFSHEVYSYFMIYAFAIPLIGGTLPFLAFELKGGSGRYPGQVSRDLYHAGMAAFTMGSVLSGVLAIFGSTNSLIRFYWIGGALLIALSLLAFALHCIRKDAQSNVV